MTLKEVIKIVIRLSLIVGIISVIIGIISCCFGIPAITGIPMILLGVFLIKMNGNLKDIVENNDSITKNLFLHFKEVKIIMILLGIVILSFLITGFVEYKYLVSIFSNSF